MKNFIVVVTIIITCVFTNMSSVKASDVNDYKQQYFASLLSMAAYNDSYSTAVKAALTAYGWDFLDNTSDNKKLKDVLLAHAVDFKAAEDSYFLAFKGTSDYADVKNDINIKLIPFAAENSSKAVITENTPLVHSGFYSNCLKLLAQPIGKEDLTQYLIKILAQKPAAHLYITGHSLGGAEAVLTAARLIELGVLPQQISVISFGAPAVGNEQFAQEYGSKINLQRIIMKGDPVRNLAQIVDARYRLFGQEIKYSQVSSDDDKISHKIILYVDRALRQYYDKKTDPLNERTANVSVIFTEPVFHIPEEQQRENINVYLQKALADITKHNIKDSVEKNTADTLAENCKYVVRTDITIKRQQKVQNSFYTAINYTIYKAEPQITNLPLFVQEKYEQYKPPADGKKQLKIITVLSASTNTVELTPIEAVLYNSSKLQPQLKNILK